MAMINEVTLPLVTNEDEILTYFEGVSEQIAHFQLEQQALGHHTYYRWQAQVKQEATFEGRMDIPSLRLYFVTQTHKGIQINLFPLPRQERIISFSDVKNAQAKTFCIKTIL